MFLTTPMSQKSRQLELPLEGEGEAFGVQRSEDGAVATQPTGDPGTGQLMELVVARENCLRALKRVRSNGGSPGIDGMRPEELTGYLRQHWSDIRASLLDGTYRPSPVRRQEIPKSDGGMRQLGIPTVLDRFIQQCILQVLEPLYDPSFSASSFGYRRGRSALAAVEQARQYLQSGCTWAVEIDLEKFFDRVNHDMLMGRIAKRISDKRLLRIVRAYLNAGVLADGVVIERAEGTPQGGPLSPLLANILLDDIDRQLEKSGHRFVRYADDLTVYVRSSRAGERVLERLRRLMAALRLTINESKSGVRPLQHHTMLGYSFRVKSGVVRLRVGEKAVKGLKRRVRKLTRRTRGRSLKRVIADLAAYLNGWLGYFGRSETPRLFRDLDQWIAHRVRAYQLKLWKRGTTMYRELRALGVPERLVRGVRRFSGSWWVLSCQRVLHIALPRRRLADMGLPTLAPQPLPLFEPPDT
jgi:RNA-directed DNA polymerase